MPSHPLALHSLSTSRRCTSKPCDLLCLQVHICWLRSRWFCNRTLPIWCFGGLGRLSLANLFLKARKFLDCLPAFQKVLRHKGSSLWRFEPASCWSPTFQSRHMLICCSNEWLWIGAHGTLYKEFRKCALKWGCFHMSTSFPFRCLLRVFKTCLLFLKLFQSGKSKWGTFICFLLGFYALGFIFFVWISF